MLNPFTLGTVPLRPPAATAHHHQRGYALLFALLFIGIVGVTLMFYQMGNARNQRYQVYYALGQQYASIARAAHTYVQDHAYYTPYVTDPTDTRQINRLAYFKTVLDTKIKTYKEPILEQTSAGNNVILLADLKKPINLADANMDVGISFARPIRGVQYQFFAHGGLMPIGAPQAIQAASALLVMYGRPAGGQADIRTIADMAAFRAGAASQGLNRIGIVLPESQRGQLTCRGGAAIVTWGSNDSDCLTNNDAATIGMALDTFDVVAPAWESVEKQLRTDVLYRRPHPGRFGTNVMYKDLEMVGNFGKFDIKDSLDIFTQSVNMVDPSTPEPILAIGDQTTGAPLSNAVLTIGRGGTAAASGERACTGTATTCIDGEINVEKNMAVAYKYDDKDPASEPDAPEDMMIVDGAVNIVQGSVTVNADESDPKYQNKGMFDVTGGDGTSTFEINGQDEGGDGTVINKRVTTNKFSIADSDNDENFIVRDALVLNGGAIQIGSAAEPKQVVLTKAALASNGGNKLAIDTTGKGANSGVYSTVTEAENFAQEGGSALTFKNLRFDEGSSGIKPSVTILGNVNVDPAGKYPNNACVGDACPDNVVKQIPPTKDPM